MSAIRFLTADEFFAPDDPNKDLVIPGLGIGHGPVIGLLGAQYTGKTWLAFDMGVSVASGKPFLGRFAVNAGPWVHLDYEQGRRHTTRKIKRVARARGVPDEQLRDWIAAGHIRIAIYPEVTLQSKNASDTFRDAFEGAKLVTGDSLRKLFGHLDENDSGVRAYLDTLSRASEATKAACVLIHHFGKNGMSRGSSGIEDEFQTKLELADGILAHTKDRELGELVPPLGVTLADVERDGDKKWGLLVSSDAAGAKRDADESKQDRLRALLAKGPVGISVIKSTFNCSGASAKKLLKQIGASQRVGGGPWELTDS